MFLYEALAVKINLNTEHILTNKKTDLQLSGEEIRKATIARVETYSKLSFLEKYAMYIINKINGLKARFKDTELELHECRDREKFYKSEVERMKGLRWYDKLFGKN